MTGVAPVHNPDRGLGRVLVIDDDRNHLRIMKGLIERRGFRVAAAGDVDAALPIVAGGDVDLVLTDLRMPGKSGLDAVALIRQRTPAVPVIVVTGHGDIESAVAAIKAGAYDFIRKPVDEQELFHAVEKALAESARNRDLVSAYFDPENPHLPEVVGRTPAIEEILRTVRKVGPTDSTVLVTGETGVGKELVARALHAVSPRRDQPLVKVNCAAIPETLAESELFGYERGAFTGAVAAKPGRFELAHGGTLFLDEIGDMPLPLQSRLLAVLQDRKFERVGGVKTIAIDVRLVAATNRDLPSEVKAGRFRADLFYRLNVVPVHVPPLRERRDDILALAEHALRRFSSRHGTPERRLSPEAASAFARYEWPGNIRELENVVERMLLLADTETLEFDLLPPEIRGSERPIGAEATFKEKVQEISGASERRLIAAALEQTGGNRTAAAALLGISRRGLQNKIKAFGL